jgi:hypothetical protein
MPWRLSDFSGTSEGRFPSHDERRWWYGTKFFKCGTFSELFTI